MLQKVTSQVPCCPALPLSKLDSIHAHPSRKSPVFRHPLPAFRVASVGAGLPWPEPGRRQPGLAAAAACLPPAGSPLPGHSLGDFLTSLLLSVKRPTRFVSQSGRGYGLHSRAHLHALSFFGDW